LKILVESGHRSLREIFSRAASAVNREITKENLKKPASKVELVDIRFRDDSVYKAAETLLDEIKPRIIIVTNVERGKLWAKILDGDKTTRLWVFYRTFKQPKLKAVWVKPVSNLSIASVRNWIQGEKKLWDRNCGPA